LVAHFKIHFPLFITQVQGQASPMNNMVIETLRAVDIQLHSFLSQHIALIGSIVGIVYFCYIVCSFLFFLLHITRKRVVLEVTPHASTTQSPLATEELFTFFYSLASPKITFLTKFFPQKTIYALELIATKKEGIRYIFCIPVDDAAIVIKSLYAYLPAIAIKEITDYMPIQNAHIVSNARWFGFTEKKLLNHFSFPLSLQTNLSQHDPIAYITGMMTKLKPDDFICLQLLISPITQHTHRTITNNINNMLDTIEEGEENSKRKGEQELFETALRFLILSSKKEDIHIRMKGLAASLQSFSSQTQSFITKNTFFLLKGLIHRCNFIKLKYRILSFTDNPILSFDEIASIYHFPYTDTTKTEGIVTSNSKKLPVSLTMVNNQENFNITFAKNTYGQEETPLGFTTEERRRHTYIIGATGTGKSTLLTTMIIQDMNKGNGLCVIDPHGDLIDKILSYIPDARVKDVILFDPSDIDFPIGMNLLELPETIDTNMIEKEKDLIASALVSVFSKLYQARFWGHRMENILRVATLTALTTEQPTLFTIQRILLDYTYRKGIVNNLTDPTLLLYWKKEFASLGSYQKASVTSPITNKIGRFLTSPHTKHILSQYKSTINFTDVMDQKKILLCNLSKGKIGEDTSSLLGSLILSKLQLAALKRAELPEEKRNDFYVYIDEFQNFATPSFGEIMSEARKYRLNAILAHQTVAQIEDKDLIKIILANTGTIISFRTRSPFDQEIILPMLAPQVESGDLGNLPSFHFYMKVNAMIPQDVCSGETRLIEHTLAKTAALKVIAYTREHYTVSRSLIEKRIQEEISHLSNAGTKKQELNKKTK
jgi:hypothetical protein